jgi:hypothetical protein
MLRLAILCMVLVSGSASAQEGSGQFTSFAGFHLDTVTLAEVEHQLGPAKLVESGDAGEYEAKIC